MATIKTVICKKKNAKSLYPITVRITKNRKFKNSDCRNCCKIEH